MRYRILKLVLTLLFTAAVSLPLTVSAHEEAPVDTTNSEVMKEKNCSDKMEMMKEQMKTMMDKHQMMMKEMNSLFTELQNSGKLSEQQMKKMENIKQMMDQMAEKMKKMSTMEGEELK
ncbi:hypothetical protein NC797_14065 [Aquibacillus sp. 3ASR75-11]|uniref:Uncharacterized protein n=1 Tax=Terrihalobacillus insolitus TaxID=2950438 RepID=A0A9X3WYG5_9BACI|nr:hypothetical protein [Terrihalobacillus insolitus]MDC3425629.1 hypothetical protein [Terrihalobacillus insolitus]